MKRTVKRIGSVLLVLCMLFMLAPSGAFAFNDPDPDDFQVVVTDEGNEISVVINGSNDAAPAGEAITAVTVLDDGNDPNLSVNNTDYDIPNDADVLVSGDVNGDGVQIKATGDYCMPGIVVDGSVAGSNIGLEAVNEKEGCSTSAQVSGDVEGGMTGAALKNSESDSSVWLEIEGSVTGGSDGVDILNLNDYSTAYVAVGGGIEGTNGVGLKAETVYTGCTQWETGDTGIEVSGGVVGGTAAVEVKSNNGSTYVTITGDASSANGDGVIASSVNRGETDVSILGGISAANGIGVQASANGDGSFLYVGAEDGIAGGTVGVQLEATNQSYAVLGTAGDVTGDTGILIKNSDSYAEVGLVYNPNEYISTSTDDLRNVNALDTALEIDQSGSNAVTAIIVDGVLSVAEGGTPIRLADTVTETDVDQISVMVWKIEGQAEGADVVSGGAAGAAAALQQNIGYIIKIADDADSQQVFGGNYAYDPNDLGSLLLSEGEREILVTVPDGFELTAYATEGTEVPIVRKDDGKYYATIPTGGGIYLRAILVGTAANPDAAPGEIQVTVTPPKAIVELSDAESNLTLSFFADGRYTAKLNDGRSERGSFKLEDGAVVLTSASGAVMPIGEDGTLVYRFANTDELSFELHFDASSIDVLRAARA